MEEYHVHVEKSRKETKPLMSSTGVAMFKVYLWFALGLLITGVVSLTIPNLLVSLVETSEDPNAIMAGYSTAIILSIVLMLPTGIVMAIQSFRRNFPVMLTSYIIYSVGMGVLLSSVMLVFVGYGSHGIYTISTAFFATGLIFLIMGLISAFSKVNFNFFVPIISTLIMGVFTISLVNILIGSEMIYWIVEFVLFGVMVIVVGIDTYNIKRLAEAGELDNPNLALYCAYRLYTDFIWIFIRILYYLLLANRRN
jgi:FtsH-binding integral membrane protein